MGNDLFADAAESTSFPLPCTGKREGGEKTQPLHLFPSHLGIPQNLKKGRANKLDSVHAVLWCLWLPVLELNQIQTRRDSDMRRQEEVEDGEMGLSKKKRESQRARGNFLEISANLPNGTLRGHPYMTSARGG